MRKPLTGNLSIAIHAVQDVDHAATGRFARGPETFVIMKVEDNFKVRTKATRTDKWMDELHDVDIEKANEVELTVYDKSGSNPTPVGMLWIRISDIAEEMRRKKIEADLGGSQWVTADKMENSGGTHSRQDSAYSSINQGPPGGSRDSRNSIGQLARQDATGAHNPGPIDAWFALEPVGRIHLTMSFSKLVARFSLFTNAHTAQQNKQKTDDRLTLDSIVKVPFGNAKKMFTSFTATSLCFNSSTTLCGAPCVEISSNTRPVCSARTANILVTRSATLKSSPNVSANPTPKLILMKRSLIIAFLIASRIFPTWGRIGAVIVVIFFHLGAKTRSVPVSPLRVLAYAALTCGIECSLSCHAQCAHLVPDFCGMSMEVANQILQVTRETKDKQGQRPVGRSTGLADRTLRPGSTRPAPPTQPSYRPTPPDDDVAVERLDPRRSHGQEVMESQAAAGQQPPAQPNQSTYGNQGALNAAVLADQTSAPQRPARPAPPDRTASSQAAMAAASAVMAEKPRRPMSDHASSAADMGSLSGIPFDKTFQPPPPGQPQYNPQNYAPYDHPQQQVPPPAAQVQQQRNYPDQSRPQQNLPVVKQQAPEQAPQAVGTGRRIGLEHFNFLTVLGKGNFGKVMLAQTKATKKLYAIKVLKKEFIIENDEVESTKSEKRVFLIANKERHPFLLNLHACFQTETRVYFVMEYISGGDLMLHIQRGQFGSKRAQFYAAEVCLALKYFHENGVVYRDLKLDNIMLTLDGHIKVADYGLCKENMWYGSTTSTFCGTPEFMAPEILLDKKYGRAVDWWAFGVLIYQMLLQQSPFRGEDEDEIYDAILADEPLYPIHMPRDSVSILQKLLMREPELRLGSGPTDAQEIMSHAFFRNINWDDVHDKKVTPPFIPQIKNPTDTSNFDSEFTSVTPVLTPVQSGKSFNSFGYC